jgi:ABC-type uncharacterized transport system substrate-binding protein
VGERTNSGLDGRTSPLICRQPVQAAGQNFFVDSDPMQARLASIKWLKAGSSTRRYEGMAKIMRVAFGGLLACAVLTSCTVPHKAPVESRTWPTPDLAKRAEKLPAKKPGPVPKAPPPVAILLSDDLPVYSRIADELVSRLPRRPDIISLQGDPAASAQAMSKINDSGPGNIVAIGPLAARTVSRLTDRQIIFCQVFNHREHGLTAAHMRGVSILPPAELQFSAWKKLDAGLSQVGVITGPDHEALIARARSAAQHHGIELIHRVVHSDKEMLYTFKRLTPGIQGLWLLPDDRILSRRVLRELMEYSNKHNKEVMVFHPKLLRLGGLISVSGTDADVAEQVVAALGTSSARTASPASGLFPLTKIHIEINPLSAQKLHIPVTSGPWVVADVP